MKRIDSSPQVSWSCVLPMLAAVAVAGCSRSGPSPAGRPAQAPGLAEPSQAERLAYAGEVVAAFDARDRAKVDSLIDWRTLVDAGTESLGISENERSEIFQGVRNSVSGEHGFAGQMIAASAQGGSLRLLGERKRQGKTVLLFRMTYPVDKGGLCYYEYVPRRFPDGKLRAADIYIYLAGEFLSEILRRLMLPMIADRSRTILDRLVTGDQDFVRDFPRIGQAGKLVSQGRSAEALAIYRTLRPGTLENKAVLLGRLRAAQEVDEKDYMAVMDDLQKLFPNDPCLDLIAIDAFLLRKDFAGALGAIDRLDRSVGGDPYLDVMRASVHELQGDHRAAFESARRAVEREPTLRDAHLVLLTFGLEQKDHGEVLARLKDLHDRFGLSFDDMEHEEEYADFVKSPRYADWLAYLKDQAKPASAKPADGPPSKR